MRVGSETREWKEGECLIFDDTVEHEVWHRGDRPRVILLLDFLRNSANSAGVSTPAGVSDAVKEIVTRS